MRKKNNKRNAHNQVPLNGLFLQQHSNRSRFAESFRTLRTNIQFSFVGKDFRSLIVTSTGPEEGKTTNAANLAYTMALGDKKVLMIDSDLRKPSLSNLAKAEDTIGLSGLLSQSFNVVVGTGSLGEYSVNDLFKLIRFQKMTGILHLAGALDKVDIYFQMGLPKDISWLTRPKEKRLGSQLLERNLLTREQLAMVLENHAAVGCKLGYVCRQMGVVEEEDLNKIITQHMLEGLRVALGFKSGKYEFEHIHGTFFDKPCLIPADLNALLRQVIIGREEVPYLQSKINESILDTGIKNLYLMPSGVIPPKPNELLDTDQMSFLLTFLRYRFDRIIIDTPPILPASDALILAPQTDGVLFVVQADKGNRDVIAKAIEQIHLTQANIVGVVLNKRDIKRKGYYYYYHYNKYYSKYYKTETDD